MPNPHPSRRDGLRAVVELASGDVAGPPAQFLLPNGPREAAALVGVGGHNEDLPATPTSGLEVVGVVVIGVYAGVLATLASAPVPTAVAVAFAAICFAAVSSAAVRVLLRSSRPPGTGAVRGQGHCVALSRADAKRIAGRAACAYADLLELGRTDAAAAFADYHQVLLSLARFELAAGQAADAARDLARLPCDDPLRCVAVQIAQDKAVHALAHRADGRAAADRLQASLRSCEGQEDATRPRRRSRAQND